MSDNSSTESEPEQYPMGTPHSPSESVEPQVTKLEKPKRILTEKQLEVLRKGRENRKKARELASKAPTEEATQAHTQAPTQGVPAIQTQNQKTKPLTKMNKKELTEQANLLSIEINNLKNADIIKKIREHGNEIPVSKDTLSEVPPPTTGNPANIIKEVHYHHYEAEPKKNTRKVSPLKDEPIKKAKKIKEVVKPLTVTKKPNIINFV
jgi:hypothetical protein